VEVDAERGGATVQTMISRDDGAARLGEVALGTDS
jgi:leucyl aminopeptidase (aminopeptidase T)